MSVKRVAVIGGGLGGLACAVRLAARGHEVEVYEAQSRPGGKAGELRLGGYRFDTGPSLLTMREVFAELFATAGERIEEWLELEPLDPVCTYYYPDGTRLRAAAGIERFAAEIELATGEPAHHVGRFLERQRAAYETAGALFLRLPIREPSTYLRRQTLLALLRPWQIDPLRTMNETIRSCFREERTVALFNRFATYNGSDPYRAPAALNMIPYIEHGLGAWGVRGGIFRVVEALEELCRRIGVRVHLRAPVSSIEVDGRRVSGVTSCGERIRCDAVVSNADIASTYQNLLLPGLRRSGRQFHRTESAAHRAVTAEPSSSALIYHWAMNRRFTDVGLHSVFFSGSTRQEFADLFQRRVVPADPTVYLYASSKVAPADAPPDGESWFVMVNAPSDRGQDWQAVAARTRDRVLARLENALGRPLQDAIALEAVRTPAEIAAETGSRFGSIYGSASNSRGAAFARHPNRIPGIGGLYACGGSVHPGGGMPLVLLSAHITADLLERHER